MVTVRITRMFIGAETLVGRIVIVSDRRSVPGTSTFDSEVIVRLAGQQALSGPRFQQSLRQGNTGRNAVMLHLIDCNTAIFLDIIFICLVARLCRNRQDGAAQPRTYQPIKKFHTTIFSETYKDKIFR